MSTIANWKREFYGFAVEMSALGLAPIAADPTTPPEGLLWYNSTLHQFRGQYAASADTLATKSYVDSALVTPGQAAGGDLGGTYPNPAVAKIGGTTVSGAATATNGGAGNATKALLLDAAGKAAGRVLETDGAKLDGIAAGATNTPLDGTAGDIAPLGPAKVAGAVGKAADAGHVHQLDKAALRVAYFAGVDASGGASHVVIGALKLGDQVIEIFNITDGANGAASFESTVTVAGQLQQPATDLRAKNFKALFVAKS
jgi:hypothetical protein